MSLAFTTARSFTTAFVALLVICITFRSSARAVSPIDIDLSPYGFKGISSGSRINGFPDHPRLLFLDDDRVAVITTSQASLKGLASHDKPDSVNRHYKAVVIRLPAGKVLSEADLGGADADNDAEVLSDGTIVLYRPGSLDLWNLRSDGTLGKQKTLKVDVHEIDEAAAHLPQAFGGGLSPSFSHKTIYLIVRAYRSEVAKVWKVTSDTIEPIDVHLLPLSIEHAVESDVAILGVLREEENCSVYVIPYGSRKPTYNIYSSTRCPGGGSSSFIGPHEIVVAGKHPAGEHPEFMTDSGDPITRSGMEDAGAITAAWNGSAYMGVRLTMSGGSEFLDISAHVSKALVTVFDNRWNKRCRFIMKVKGADLSGPYLSPKGDRIVAYDNGHFYAWNVTELAGG